MLCGRDVLICIPYHSRHDQQYIEVHFGGALLRWEYLGSRCYHGRLTEPPVRRAATRPNGHRVDSPTLLVHALTRRSKHHRGCRQTSPATARHLYLLVAACQSERALFVQQDKPEQTVIDAGCAQFARVSLSPFTDGLRLRGLDWALSHIPPFRKV